MQVTITHPVAGFTGVVTVRGTVRLAFTDGTCQQDVDPRSFEAIVDAGMAVTIGAQEPGPPYDANLDTSVAAIVQAGNSTTSGALSAAYGTLDQTTHGAKATALRAFHAALANRDSVRCNIVAFGDSMTEGPTSSAVGKRWVNRLQSILNARFPAAGLTTHGDGFYPPAYVGNSFAPPVAMTGTWTTNLAFGPGNRGQYADAAATMTFTVTATSFSVMYVGSPATGTFSVSVDGGAPVTVDSSSGMSIIIDGRLYTVTGLTAAVHTVEITWVSGTVYIDGIIVHHGDEDAGIVVYEAGHSGWTSLQYIQQGTYMNGALAAFAPDLVLIGLGENDIAIGPVTSASFQANLQTLIANLRALTTAHPPSIVLWAGEESRGAQTAAEPWANYVQAMHNVSAADTGGQGGASGVTVLDMTRRTAGLRNNTLGLWNSTDGVHPTDKGQALIADAFAGFLAP